MENENNEQASAQPSAPKGHGRGWTIGVIILVIILGVIVFWHKPGQTPPAGENSQVQGAEVSGQSMENQKSGPEAGQNMDMPAQTSSTPPQPPADNGALNDQGQKVFTVHGGSYYFSPNQITVNKGDKVKIVFTADSGFHDFVLDEFNVKTERVSGGQTASAEFTADKTGSFEFYCSVGNHRAMGMKGQLIVQ